MNALKLLAGAAVVCLAGASARAEDKPDYVKLVVGKWEVSNTDEESVPKGAAIEFTKDGKVKFTGKKDDAEVSIDGTYTLDGNKLTAVMKMGDMEQKHTITITKISDTEMAVEGEDGKKVELTRKK